MILAPSDVKVLTGYVRASAQARWLHRHGWRFVINGCGRPVVARAEFERLTGNHYVPPQTILTIAELRALQSGDPFGPGVYFLWDGPELLYIGRSGRMRSRMEEHRFQDRIPFVDATCIACAEEMSREDLELAYIRAYRPPFNLQVR